MSMIWRSAMPLLTTLAALIIIVNCLEEDLDTDYRHDLRPRILDTETHAYDQSWRAIEETPVIDQPSHTAGWDEGSPDRPPKRRRPGRKRKRRPQPNTESELEPQERYAYPDEPPRPYYDVNIENDRQTTEMPKKRRKKNDQRPIRWTDDEVMVVERPLRKRGMRKRPSFEQWPVRSEFGHFNFAHDLREDKTEAPDQGNTDIIHEGNPLTVQRTYENDVPAVIADIVQNPNPQVADDKSLSEFSFELVNSLRATRPKMHERFQGKSTNVFKETLKNDDYDENKYVADTTEQPDDQINEVDVSTKHDQYYSEYRVLGHKSKGNILLTQWDTFRESEDVAVVPEAIADNPSHMDPITLKDILKRSNGTSLSEILQQHNLTLTDLLSGKEHAISLFKLKDSLEDQNKNLEVKNDLPDKEIETKPDIKEESDEILIHPAIKFTTESVTEYLTTTTEELINKKEETEETTTTEKPVEESMHRISTRRRYPTGLRKKLRMRPMLNVTRTYKGQLSRDLISLNARKYSHHRRNSTKSREWLDLIQSMNSNNTYHENNSNTTHETTTVNIIPEETTIAIEFINNNGSFDDIQSQILINSGLDDVNMEATESTNNPGTDSTIITETTIVTDFTTETEPTIVTEILTETPKPIIDRPHSLVVTMPRPTAVSSGLRRQAFNNRLKRKRQKHKNSTTEPPQDDLINHLFGMGNLVSSSEFIERTQKPRTISDTSEHFTTLDDVSVTETTNKTDGPMKIKMLSTRVTPKSITEITTPQTAKIEIEEIFKDSQTSKKLATILRERNMTISELLEHRERGSSHVHLADIFHNASREPNPPEPFLSKSLLEPISKETYPLRAILEANLHDPNGKVTTIDPNVLSNMNIPVVMDYRSNVNENAENMGIMSLFNNFTKHARSTLLDDFEGLNHKKTDASPNVTKTKDTVRESRLLGVVQDEISWNEILSLVGKTNNESEESTTARPFEKITIDDDPDSEGLLVLEDLQNLIDFGDSVVSDSNEKLDLQTIDKNEHIKDIGILNKIPSQTKSVTVATASIAGLAMILFLLTYAAFKWRQQRTMISNKRSFNDERIPSPVFENRKGHKNNSSSRSISPMLQTSNIYTLNTLDSKTGKESPDYMWDSLRKPFQ